jgi:hypothetical protein
LRHYAASQNIAGSNPDEVIGIFKVSESFQQQQRLGVYSASKRNDLTRVKPGQRVRLTTSLRSTIYIYTPAIANEMFFILLQSFTTTCFGPYGPSSSGT